MILDLWGEGGLVSYRDQHCASCVKLHHCYLSTHHQPDRNLPAAQQTPREGSYHLHYHRLYANPSKPNSETRLEARNVLVEPGSVRTRSFSPIPKETPVEVVLQVWAVVASAGQVHGCRVIAEVRRLTRSNVHRCRAMSTGERAGAVLRDMSSSR